MTEAAGTDWHRIPAADVLATLGTDPAAGLTTTEATARLQRYGRNELIDKGAKSPWSILWEQLTAVMVLILIGAAVLSFLLGKVLEGGTILAVVVLFALLGFLQEYRAEQAIAALKKLAVPTVRVMRDGSLTEIDASLLVPGDVVLLEAGNVVPADARLVESANLRIQEAALTGESEPVEKHTLGIDRDDVGLGDRANMAWFGTQVTYGRGSAVVTGTGMSTELGRIATLLQDVASEMTPLQHRLDRVGKQLALAGVAVAIVVMGLGALAGESFTDLVLTAISVAVAVIPEGLPAVVTFTLAIGAQRMLRRNALIRKLPAVETLGSVTTICSDKTGTLTENRMTVTAITVPGGNVAIDPSTSLHDAGSAVRVVLAAGDLCNDGTLTVGDSDEPVTIGDPTETALLVAAYRAGLLADAVRAAAPRVAELPFDSERKRMTTVHRVDDPSVAPELGALMPPGWYLSITKGAVDGLLDLAVGVWDDGAVRPLDAERRSAIERANAEMAGNGMRVLGVAYRVLGDPSEVAGAERDLVMLGLFGIIDPPRAEVRDAVATCRAAGIRPVMITGDHPLTASFIARDLGIADDHNVVTGADLDRLPEGQLADLAERTSVFARVSPEHKLRIVEALRDRGHVVAMTGDGVNDAPALKKADIGVAMGITGTDVSKEASDMVLRDDNFATIVAAVEEGRVIYDNLRRFVKFAVAGNIGKIIVMLLWPVPFLVTGADPMDAVALLPLQLLWLNLMTDGLLGLSMGVEPAERTVMKRPPHSPSAGIFSGGLGVQAVWIGTVIGVLSLGVGIWYHEADRIEFQTMMFTSLAFLQIFQALATRSDTESLFRLGLRSNMVMTGTVAGVAALQLLALYTPLREFLGLERLGAVDLAICIGLGVVLFVLVELDKVRRSRALRA